MISDCFVLFRGIKTVEYRPDFKAMGIKDRLKTGNALDAAFISSMSWLKMRMAGSSKRIRPAETRTDSTRLIAMPKRK